MKQKFKTGLKKESEIDNYEQVTVKKNQKVYRWWQREIEKGIHSLSKIREGFFSVFTKALAFD